MYKLLLSETRPLCRNNFNVWMTMFFIFNVELSVSGAQIEALKRITKADLISWFMEHRHSNSRRLSIHVSAVYVCFSTNVSK